MKKQILLIALMIGSITLSCSTDDDNNDYQESEFQGEWIGTYTGDKDNGSWTAYIDSEGEVTGTTTSSVLNSSLELNGEISPSGGFTATAGTTSNGAEFKGQMSETNGSGTWVNTSQGINGTWSGNKQ